VHNKSKIQQRIHATSCTAQVHIKSKAYDKSTASQHVKVSYRPGMKPWVMGHRSLVSDSDLVGDG